MPPSTDMDLAGKRVLITGAAGFIGSHLVKAVVGRGASVVALDDFSNGRIENIAGSEHATVLRQASVLDKEAVARAAVGTHVVFHLAALNLVRSIADPSMDLMVNAMGTLNVLQAARDAGTVAVVVNASTGSVYGEPEYWPQDERHPLAPVSPYGVSKLAGERYATLWPTLAGLPTVSLRYYNVYGPRQRYASDGGVIPIFIHRALKGQPLTIHGTGEQERCFTYVGDVVRSTIAAAETKSAWNDVYNIATDEVTTVIQLAERVLNTVGARKPLEFAPPRQGDIRSFRPSIEKARRKLGYVPAVPLEEGLRSTSEWMMREIKSGKT